MYKSEYLNGSMFVQTLETLKRMRPKQALLVGMTHDYDHDRYNRLLEEWSSR